MGFMHNYHSWMILIDHHILWEVYVLPLRCPCLFAWCWRKNASRLTGKKYNSTHHFSDVVTEMGGPRCGVPWVPWYMAGLWITLPHLTTQTMGIQLWHHGDWPATIGSPGKRGWIFGPKPVCPEKTSRLTFFFGFWTLKRWLFGPKPVVISL